MQAPVSGLGSGLDVRRMKKRVPFASVGAFAEFLERFGEVVPWASGDGFRLQRDQRGWKLKNSNRN